MWALWPAKDDEVPLCSGTRPESPGELVILNEYRSGSTFFTLTPLPSPSGLGVIRPRDGFSPTRPHMLAGIRMEPAPSPPLATATIPPATAAALPPLEPPGDRDVSQRLWVGPRDSGSVIPSSPSSGVLERRP
jgi:hypothetical protein